MTKPNDGGPAFPIHATWTPNGDGFHCGNDGMTLRDYFAAAALQGVLQAMLRAPDADIARQAYGIADAMLKARDTGGTR